MGFLLPVLLLLLLQSISQAPTVCGNAELTALMEIKASLDPKNNHLSSWTEEGDPCSGSFEGVACNEHRKIANISLQGKGLSGTISPSVAKLKCLSGLYLHYNSLSGYIPKEIANLTELVDLYLDVNNLSGSIPSQITNMASLQVIQLCCNQLTGIIPINIGSMKKLNVVALQDNKLTGSIPSSLANLEMLKRLDLSFNNLSGPIPSRLANNIQQPLQVLDVKNNTLYGVVPPSLKRLLNHGGLHLDNNPGLCGTGFPKLRNCTSWDRVNSNSDQPDDPIAGYTGSESIIQPPNFHPKGSSQVSQFVIITGVTAITVSLVVASFLVFLKFRREKQKIGSTFDISEDERISSDQGKELSRMQPSSEDGGVKFNLEEVESATQYFSDINLLGKSSFSAVYKGILKNGSNVAIKSINTTSFLSDETEFVKGITLLTSLRHENLVRLRGFCYSKGRGECFLIYDFATKGSLSQYLDVEEGSSDVLDWLTRVHIINGIAKGLGYLHNKSGIVHQNISVEKVLIDGSFNPLIMDSGLLKLLADDVIFSALKASAALGYMAPEYITTGRFTESSDVYAFGVIILQILSGKSKLTNMMRVAAESSRLEDFIDPTLKTSLLLNSEAAKLTEIALSCTHEIPDQRPSMDFVLQELSR
ncbi:probable LRR receptor-like serine/threonine-protein kinase IRK [Impatiens glandulifera]|uniref:probable LRR receptor-like serine/threonine-protein kinase IRK n=1 Tax=Impatiens glandulifera TaxID=253017 RepID=UPI001FB1556C|nr:probable LRR receptor-like serine/threonine-protein kinase IRK [Impatiens glandulifera]